MTLLIDKIINLFKWPVAILAVINLPYLCTEMVKLMSFGLKPSMWPFWVGMIGYIVLWRLIFSGRGWGSSLPTLIHECIHALFAIITLHRVVDLRVRWNSGGHVSYVGGPGNWLITISPYFFPLALLVAMGVSAIVHMAEINRLLLLGAVFGFEIVYTWREIHPQQTDLHKVGFVFAFAFLPSALLFSYGAVLSFAIGGFVQLHWFWYHFWHGNIERFLSWF